MVSHFVLFYRCEIFRVLLLLLIQPTSQNIGPNLTSVLEKYAWESSSQSPMVDLNQSSPTNGPGSSNPTPGGVNGNQYLSEEVFLLIQSIVMAVQVRDGNALNELEDYLVPHLEREPLQRDLLRNLVKSMSD